MVHKQETGMPFIFFPKYLIFHLAVLDFVFMRITL